MSAPIVFVKVGWMNFYNGPSDADPTHGGHGHLEKSTVGHDFWIFEPTGDSF